MTDEQLREAARRYVDEVWEDVVKDIDYLVQVESVEDLDGAAEGMPFGPAPHEAMRRGLEILERLGLDTVDCEGYLGYGELKGASDTYLATIAHSDIVPLGEGWHVNPLRVTRRDGYLIGRGVLDDKGPLVLSMYAAAFFRRVVEREGRPLPYTLRCLVGSNEETGMKDVEYYLENHPQPVFCFSPDAMFPVICGEKGHFGAAVRTSLFTDGVICELVGGTVPNAIPGKASALVRGSAASLVGRAHIEVEDAGTDDDGTPLVRVTATGKGGHASMPEGTVNAIALLIDYLAENLELSEGERSFVEFERTLLADTAGDALGIASADDAFGPLTCIGGTIRTERESTGVRFVQTLDSRYPTSTTAEALTDRIGAVARRHDMELVSHSHMVPFYIAPDSPEISCLVNTCNEVRGTDEQAFTIGGGTYARHFARAVAFGPDDPTIENPSWVGPEHGPDEGVSELALRRALEIYILTIDRLMRLSL